MKIAALLFVLSIAITVTAMYVCVPGENHETLCNECVCVTRGTSQAWKCVRKKCDSNGDLKKYYQEKYRGQLIGQDSAPTKVAAVTSAQQEDLTTGTSDNAPHEGYTTVADAPQVARYRYANNNKYDL